MKVSAKSPTNWFLILEDVPANRVEGEVQRFWESFKSRRFKEEDFERWVPISRDNSLPVGGWRDKV